MSYGDMAVCKIEIGYVQIGVVMHSVMAVIGKTI